MNTQSFRVEIPKYGARGTCFWRKARWWLRFTADKKIKRVSLKTTDAKIAKAKAISFLTILGDQGMAKLKETANMRDTAPTIGEIIDHYEKVTDCATHKKNSNALLRVIARAKGWVTEIPVVYGVSR